MGHGSEDELLDDDREGPPDSDSVRSYDSAYDDSNSDDDSGCVYHARPAARRRSTARPSPAPTSPRGRMVLNEDVDVPLSEAVTDEDGASSSFDLQPSTSQMYQDEDEESEDEEEVHLEVRTRRPSASAAEMSPPRRSLSAHRALSSPPRREGKQRPMICT